MFLSKKDPMTRQTSALLAHQEAKPLLPAAEACFPVMGGEPLGQGGVKIKDAKHYKASVRRLVADFGVETKPPFLCECMMMSPL